MDLLSNRVPAGVDEAAYVKAGFLSALAKGEAKSPLIDQLLAVKLLGTMLGGYNISTLVDIVDFLHTKVDFLTESTMVGHPYDFEKC